MEKHYTHLTAEERAGIMLMLSEGYSQRHIARHLGRSPSSISREIHRHAPTRADAAPACYDAAHAGRSAQARRLKPRRPRKLTPGSQLFELVVGYLREGWSPEQMAGIFKHTWPLEWKRTVSHETIYNMIDAHPKGELRRELIACQRQGRSTRKPRSGGKDRRGGIPDMVSIHVRPPEVEDRQMPGHWEGDFIKGKNNASSVGVLVERVSRLVLLARMDDATAASALKGFSEKLNSIAAPMRQSLTYDQGREMAKHRELTAQTGVKVYFCDPHSPWQRGSCENTNGLLRQYLPKGTDLSVYSQEELDAIADSLNNRPRAVHNFASPLAVFRAMLESLDQPDSARH